MEAPSKESPASGANQKTPLGLPRVFFPIYYTFVLCVAGYAISATEPFKKLLAMAGVCGHLPVKEQKEMWCCITNAGVTISIMASVIAGAFADFAGPKITAMISQLFFGGGYALIFFSPIDAIWLHYTGSALLGLAFIGMFVSHTSVAALFPANPTLVLAIIGSGPDISLFVPNIIARVGTYVGIKWAIGGYLVVISIIFVAEMFLVPFKAFEAPPVILESEAEAHPLMNDNTSNQDTEALVERPPTTSMTKGYAHLPLAGQLKTPHFWILALFTGLNMFRKVHYMQLVSDINEDIGNTTNNPSDNVAFYTSIYAMTLWTAVFPALGMGALTDAFGVIASLIVENTWGLLLYLCCSLAIMQLQWASIVFFNLMSSYTFGLIFASLATYYGLRTLGTLQGVQLFIAGLFSQCFNYWNSYFVSKLPTIRYANMTLFAVSIVLYLVPLYFYLKPPGCKIEPTEEDRSKQKLSIPQIITSHYDRTMIDRRSSAAYGATAAPYDRQSLNTLRRSLDNKAHQF